MKRVNEGTGIIFVSVAYHHIFEPERLTYQSNTLVLNLKSQATCESD